MVPVYCPVKYTLEPTSVAMAYPISAPVEPARAVHKTFPVEEYFVIKTSELPTDVNVFAKKDPSGFKGL